VVAHADHVPFPAGLPLVTVTIQFDAVPNGGGEGTVRFRNLVELVGPTANSIVPPINRTADVAENGSGSIQLPPCNHPDWEPDTGWNYEVLAFVDGEEVRGTMFLDYQTLTVNLADVFVADGRVSPGTVSYVTPAQLAAGLATKADQADVDELDDDVDTLTVQVGALSDEVSDLAGQIGGFATVTQLNDGLATKADITAVDALGDTVTTLSGTVTALGNDVATLTTTVGGKADQTQVDQIETDLATTTADLAQLEQDTTAALAGKAAATNASVTGYVRVVGPPETFRQVQLASGPDEEDVRWSIHANNTAESGGGAGSDLRVVRYSDTGVPLDAPWGINRATGQVDVPDLQVVDLAVTGTATGITAAMVGDLAAAITTAMRAADPRIVDGGEYVLDRGRITLQTPATTENLWVTHFTAATGTPKLTLETKTGDVSTCATGGEHAWVGVLTWNPDTMQYLPNAASEDIPDLWSGAYTVYNTPIYQWDTVGDPDPVEGFFPAVGGTYAAFILWIGSGDAPDLPAATGWYADSTVEPRTNAWIGSQSAPPSAPMDAAWFAPDSRMFQGLLRDE
jgi:outer membrane murein-binding lipoprotein Lpp